MSHPSNRPPDSAAPSSAPHDVTLDSVHLDSESGRGSTRNLDDHNTIDSAPPPRPVEVHDDSGGTVPLREAADSVAPDGSLPLTIPETLFPPASPPGAVDATEQIDGVPSAVPCADDGTQQLDGSSRPTGGSADDRTQYETYRTVAPAPPPMQHAVTTDDVSAPARATDRPHSPLTSGLAAESRVPTQPMQKGRGGKPDFPGVAGYELLDELGRGGMGVVFKARHIQLNRLVALKMILAGGRASKADMARFRAEAEAVAKIQHANIVQIYDIGESAGQPYFALEFVEGGTLEGRTNRYPQPPLQAARLVALLADAMQAAHSRGILHRDLKPANVLVAGPQGVPLDQLTPKITDFGLAKKLEGDSGMTREGSVMGTPSYMAPEQARGKIKELGPHTDVYALGAILYDLLTGGPPFRGETVMDTLQQVIARDPLPPARLQPTVPRDLETICLKCLEKEPARRYATSAELGADLRRFVSNEPILARATPAWERAYKWTRRNPTSAALVAMSVLMLLGIAAGGVWFGRAEQQRAAAEKLLREEAQRQERIASEERMRAEAHFAQAHEAVDALTQLGHRRLARLPHAEPIRRELLQLALDFHRRFIETSGDSPERRLDLGVAHHKLGEIQEKLGRPAEAEKSYRAAQAVFEELQAAQPNAVALRRHLALVWNDLAILLHSTKRQDEALQQFDRAIAEKEKLLAEEPNNTRSRQELANSYSARGVLHAAAGRADLAESDYLRAQQILKPQDGEAAPLDDDRQQALAHTYLQLGALWTGRAPAKADDAYGQALPLWEDLAQRSRRDPRWQHYLAMTLRNRATMRQAAKQGDAQADYERAAPILERLVENFPGVPEYRRELARAYIDWGQLLREKKPQQAEAVWRKSIPLLEGLARDYPGELEFRQLLGRSYNEWAMALATTGRLPEAEKAFRDAVNLQDALVAEQPGDRAIWQDLVFSARNLVSLLLALPPSAQTEKASQDLVAVLRRRVEAFPNEVDYRAELAAGLHQLGEIRLETDQAPAARAALAEAVREQRAVLPKRKQAADRAALGKYAKREVEAILKAGDHTAAAAAIRAHRAKSSVDSKEPAALPELAAAVLFAQCVEAAGKDSKLDEAARKKAQQDYGDSAMALLTHAATTGRVDVKQLARAPELAALRTRDDFKKLIEAKP